MLCINTDNGYGSGYYQCKYGSEWEHENRWENDGTPENLDSDLTSIGTDRSP